jgi:Uma2 family endonuclease
MATVLEPSEQRVLLEGVSWEIFEGLVRASPNRGAPRFTYDRGRLEIMSPSAEHERLKETATLLVNIVAEELRINVEALGSTTFRRPDAGRGFEADSCFYVQNLDRVKGKADIDLRVDPPPDLVVEIDVTTSPLDKLSIFATLGVPEVWRYHDARVRIFRLAQGALVARDESAALPGVTAELVTRWLSAARTLDRLTWLRQVRTSVRDLPREVRE